MNRPVVGENSFSRKVNRALRPPDVRFSSAGRSDIGIPGIQKRLFGISDVADRRIGG